jgi:sporulation protein YlmC with PRC-barrel domain
VELKVTYDNKDVLDKDSVIVVSTLMTSLDSITELPLQLRNGITYTCPFSINSFYIYTDRYFIINPKPIQIGSVKNVIVNIEQRSDNLEGLIGYTVPNDMIVGNKYTIKVRISRENNITKLVVGDRNIPISSDDNTTVNIEYNYITCYVCLSIYKQG